MIVQDLMTTPVSTCTPDTNLATAAMRMWSTDCGVLPVVNENGGVVGMITDRDICMAAATQHRDIAEIPVGSIITTRVKSCGPDDDLSDALREMEQEKLHRLPVIGNDGRLQGILSINDVILQVEKESTNGPRKVSYEELVKTLKGISAHWLPVAAGNGHGSKEPPGQTRQKSRRARKHGESIARPGR
jgi:CBS domain-containing protein